MQNDFNTVNVYGNINNIGNVPESSEKSDKKLEKIEKIEKNEKKEVQPDQGELNGRKVVYALVATAVAIVLAVAVYEAALLICEIAHDKIWKPDLQKLEQSIKEKFQAPLIEKFKELKGIDITRLFKRLALCEEDEKDIFNHLSENFDLTPNQLQEILMGAHVRLDDDGKMYDEWMNKIKSKQSRISSHPSNATQYGVRGPLVKELLFSRINENGKAFTWFQLENHPVTFGHIIRHMVDYVKYKLSGKNQGPDGSSEATHHNPILISQKKEGVVA